MEAHEKDFFKHWKEIIKEVEGQLSKETITEDLNIISKDELVCSLKFWRNYALKFYKEDVNSIDVTTIKNFCPYKNLYLAIS